jgi:tRNA1(Val) A37 N6-methylase TrmN6
MRILERPPDHKFTYSYSQPAEYRFCQDSVIFPRVVADRVKLDENSRVLDLCAGCGVIGFELAFYLPQIKNLDFAEVQDSFRPHFEENLKITGKNFRFLNMNYADLLKPEFEKTYDLIVANPPYFDPKEGKPSPVELNNRARFFIDSDFATLIKAVKHALKPGGEAYLLVKDARAAAGEIVADIRGTKAIRVSRSDS